MNQATQIGRCLFRETPLDLYVAYKCGKLQTIFLRSQRRATRLARGRRVRAQIRDANPSIKILQITKGTGGVTGPCLFTCPCLKRNVIQPQLFSLFTFTSPFRIYVARGEISKYFFHVVQRIRNFIHKRCCFDSIRIFVAGHIEKTIHNYLKTV